MELDHIVTKNGEMILLNYDTSREFSNNPVWIAKFRDGGPNVGQGATKHEALLKLISGLKNTVADIEEATLEKCGVIHAEYNLNGQKVIECSAANRPAAKEAHCTACQLQFEMHRLGWKFTQIVVVEQKVNEMRGDDLVYFFHMECFKKWTKQ